MVIQKNNEEKLDFQMNENTQGNVVDVGRRNINV